MTMTPVLTPQSVGGSLGSGTLVDGTPVSSGTHARMHSVLALAARGYHRQHLACEVCGELSGSIAGSADTRYGEQILRDMAAAVPEVEDLDVSPYHRPVPPHRRHLYPALPLGWERMTWQTLQVDATNEDVVTIAQAWAETPGGVLVLLGSTGVGKTHLCSALTQDLIERGQDCSVWEWDAWHDTLRAAFDGDRDSVTAFANRMFRAEILILDDIRAEHTSQAVREMFERIVNRRTQEQRPILLTTNATEQEWNAWSSRAYSRLRAREYGTWLPLISHDRRLAAPAGQAPLERTL